MIHHHKYSGKTNFCIGTHIACENDMVKFPWNLGMIGIK